MNCYVWALLNRKLAIYIKQGWLFNLKYKFVYEYDINTRHKIVKLIYYILFNGILIFICIRYLKLKLSITNVISKISAWVSGEIFNADHVNHYYWICFIISSRNLKITVVISYLNTPRINSTHSNRFYLKSHHFFSYFIHVEYSIY